MAEIWVSSTCAVCGHRIKAGEPAILEATVKTTQAETYGGSYGATRGKLRVNFFGGSSRILRHPECVPAGVKESAP